MERGVRFEQLYHEPWDQHGSLVKDVKQNCKVTDQACAALVQDLKQRGMLKDTLVVGRRIRLHTDDARWQ